MALHPIASRSKAELVVTSVADQLAQRPRTTPAARSNDEERLKLDFIVGIIA